MPPPSAPVAAGGKILNGPMDVPDGDRSERMDPQGAAFGLHTKKK
jgi:predicted enzyme related to lactoylglutathione lyase